MNENYKRIIANVGNMIAKQAPESDIDEYLKYEGLTPKQFKSLVEGPTILGQTKEFLKGIPTGVVNTLESAAIGASAVLPEEAEKATREYIKEKATAARAPFVAAPGYEEGIPSKAGQTIGSLGPYVIGGPFGAAGRVAAVGLAGASGAGEARTRAEEAGATPEERSKATALGTGVGLSEVIPVFQFFNRLGKETKDGILAAIQRAFTTGGSEGAQEAAAQIAQNLIAKGIYKPDEAVLGGSGESGAYGFGVGALIQGLTDLALGRRAPSAPPPGAPAAGTAPEAPPAPAAPGLPEDYARAVQEVEQLKRVPLTPEVQARLAQLEAYKNRLVMDDIERLQRKPFAEPGSLEEQIKNQSVTQGEFRETLDLPTREVAPEPEEAAPKEMPTVLAPEVLDGTGLTKQSGIYKQLLGKDLQNLEDLDAVMQTVERARSNESLSESTKNALESIATNAFNLYGQQGELFGPRGGRLPTPPKPTPVQKKIAAITAGKDLTDPAQVEEVRELLTDYANAPNRSQSAIDQIDEFLQSLPPSTPEATDVIQPTEPVAPAVEPSSTMADERGEVRPGGAEESIATGLGTTPAVAGEPDVGAGVQSTALAPEEEAALQEEQPAALEEQPGKLRAAFLEANRFTPASANFTQPIEGKLDLRDAIDTLVAGGMKRAAAAEYVNTNSDSFGTIDTADVDAAINKVSGKAKYREGAPGEGIPQSRVQRIVDGIQARWKNAPKTQVVQDIQELPQELYQQMVRDDAMSAPGVYDPNTETVYLIADNITSDKEAVLTLIHESFGHFGIQSVLGNTYGKVMDDIYNGNAKVRELANKKIDRDKLSKHDAVEEVLAEMAEKGIYNNAIQRVFNAIRQFLRSLGRLGGFEMSKVTDNEIRALLANAQRFVVGKGVKREGAKAFANKPMYRAGSDAFKKWFGNSVVRNANGTPKMMYHGTARDIEEFRPKQAGAIFLTEDPRFAEGFAYGSEDWMQRHAEEFFTQKQITQFRKEAEAIAKREGTFVGDELGRILAENMPSGPNLLPVYVSAQNPFDYENPAHMEAVISELGRTGAYKDMRNNNWVDDVRNGGWGAIESAPLQTALKALGFDGFYVMEGNRKNLGVYDSSQIKSAFNKGSYDPIDKRISYRRKETLTSEGEKAAALNERMKGISNPAEDGADTVGKGLAGVHHFFTRKDGPSWWTRARQAIVDKDASANEKLEAKFNNALIDAMGNVRADLLVDQAQDAASFAENVLDNGGIKINKAGLVETYVRDDGVSMKKVFEIISDKLGKKLGSTDLAFQVAHNALIANRAKEINIHNAKVQNNIDAALAKGNKKAAAELEKTKVTIRASQEEIDAGLEAMNTYPEIKEALEVFTKYKNGLVDFLQETGRINAETAKNWKENAGYVPWTRIEEEVSLLDESPVSYKTGLINLSQLPKLDREGSTKEIANVFDNIIGLTNWAVKTGLKTRAASAMAKQLDDVIELKTDAALKREQKNNPGRVIYTYKNGERTAYLVGSVLDIPVFSTNIEVLGPMMKAFKAVGDFQRGAITHMPAFALTQLVQDGTYRAALLSGVEKPFQLSLRVFKNFGKALRGDLSEVAALGVTGVYDGMPDQMIERAQVRYGLKERGLAKKAWDMLEKFSLAADLAVRSAIYEQTIAETKSAAMPDGDQRLALYRAKEYINFKRAGASPTIRTLRHTVPFMNAYIQGTDVLIRTMRGKGVSLQEKRKAQQLFLATGLKLAALNAMYTMLVSGDDEYEGLEEYERDKNYIIPGTGIKIPVAPEVGFLFKVIPERLLRYIVSQGTERPQDANTFYTGFRDAFITAYGGINLTPQIIKPSLEVLVNYSFFTSNPIVGRGMSEEAEFQFNSGTSEFAKLFGKVGLSPLKVDYLAKAYTGMAGAIVLDITDAIADPDRATKPIFKTPQISTFMYDPTGRGYKSDFYRFRESVDKVVDTVNMFKREGRDEELEEYLTEDRLKLYAMKGVTGKVLDTLSNLRKQRNIIANDKELSGAEKRELVNELLAQEKEILLEYNIPQIRKEMEE